jgi:hypothetical protein
MVKLPIWLPIVRTRGGRKFCVGWTARLKLLISFVWRMHERFYRAAYQRLSYGFDVPLGGFLASPAIPRPVRAGLERQCRRPRLTS